MGGHEADLDAIDRIRRHKRNPMSTQAKKTDITLLKKLLQAEQQHEIQELRTRIAEIEGRQVEKGNLKTSMSEELVDAISEMGDDRRDRLTHTISAMMADTVDSKIRDHEPILIDRMNREAGTMVKRGIVQAIAEFAESLQQQINNQLSFSQRAKNAVTAARTGTGEAQIAIQNALQGTPTKALLLHRPTGLLVAAANKNDLDEDGASGGDQDGEAIKGSLISAIINFANDAMGGDGAGDSLSTLKFGDRSLVLSVQNLSVLALEVEGVLPAGINSWLDGQMAELIADHHETLEAFKGDLSVPEGLAIEGKLHHLIGQGWAQSNDSFAPIVEATQAGPAQVLGKAAPFAAAFLILVGGAFFASKALYAKSIEGRAAEAFSQVAAGKSWDLEWRYSPATSKLWATDGGVQGQQIFIQAQNRVAAELPFATLDLSRVEVIEDQGAGQ